MEQRDDAALDRALETLQEAAQTAVVPGDQRPWLEQVRSRLHDVRGELEAQAGREEGILEKIVREDMELAGRVDELRGTARELHERLERWARRLGALLDEDDARSAGSGEPVGKAEELRREVLEWIVDFRAHRGELRTWLQEAVQRDRGVVD